MADQIKDLRRNTRQGFKRFFSLQDIVYSNCDNEYNNVTKMIIIEKQPEYVIYKNNYYNAVAEMGAGFLAKSGFKSGKALSQIMAGAAKQVAGQVQNTVINNASRSGKESVDLNIDFAYGKGIRTLFNADIVRTFEVPYFSNYFIDVDGTQGWETNGMESAVGSFASILEHANIGYPVAPIWRYDAKKPSTMFEFNLLNHDTASLVKNLTFLMAIVPGMLHVLLQMNEGNRKTILNGLENSVKQTAESDGNDGKTPKFRVDVNQFGSWVIDTLGDKVFDIAKLADTMTTMFKSPNVYEIVVPGRFRWLWCTMNMTVENVGKIYNDIVNIQNHSVFGGEASLVGFPEAYKVRISINSLLPQSFNEFYYFASDTDFKNSLTEQYKNKEGKNVSTTADGGKIKK
jgi:hypothetical protein